MKRRKKLLLKLMTYIATMTIALNYARIGAEKTELKLRLVVRNHFLFEQAMTTAINNGIISYNGFVILP